MNWTTLFDLMISNVSQKGSSLIRGFFYVKNYFFKAKAIKIFQVVTSKTVYLCHLLSYRESKKGQQKTPVSRRENGVLESGTEGTRTLDLRLDRKKVLNSRICKLHNI